MNAHSLTRINASPSFLSSKVSLDEGDGDFNHTKLRRMSWDMGWVGFGMSYIDTVEVSQDLIVLVLTLAWAE